MKLQKKNELTRNWSLPVVFVGSKVITELTMLPATVPPLARCTRTLSPSL